METLLLVGGGLVCLSIVLIPAFRRLGAPLLLLFLGIGMLAGEDGPGRIQFDDFELAYDIGSVALAIILFSGGLATSFDALRIAWRPAVVLASFGVAATAGLVACVAVLALDFPWPMALLLGSVVGSTDAAATFLLLRQGNVRLKGRLQETLELESALNDPMAIFLTTVFVTIVNASAPATGGSFVLLLAQQLLLGAGAGVIGGYLIQRGIHRLPLDPTLRATLALSGALTLFAGTQLAGGSGFLAAYLAGLIGGREMEKTPELAHFHDALGWLSQIVMFLMLGLLVTPRALANEWQDASVTALAMIFIARPLAVILLAWPFGFAPREQLYLSWVGLRGAVPIFLAIIPVVSPGPLTVRFFNTVFVVVIVSLLLQGTTLNWLARRLGLVDEP